MLKGDPVKSETIQVPAPTIQLMAALAFRFVLVLVMLGALLFGTAGSMQYWNGWLFIAALFVPMMVVCILLFSRNRPLLEKRMRMREKEREQKAYIRLSLLWFLISFAIPGLDYRFGWSQVPLWLIVVSVVVMLSGYTLFIVAMMQNTYASRIIELQPEQRLVDSGLYSVVRHPMYMAAMILYTACPLVLGSYYALLPALLLPPLLIYRLLNEEKLLRAGLPGYDEYTKRVKFRLIPFVW